jgi:protein-glutamine gamma-glutamyltransferase
VDAALALFADGNFTYTLTPDRLGSDSVDDFLFVSRKGFCEHFAAAFAVLMRAAGLPTRLVGGYQGGRWNPVGQFMSVRQSDAHVWCEVWMADRGWVRIDPTFAVAPDRIELGIEAAIGEEGLPGFLTAGGDFWLARWRRTLVDTWDAFNSRWNFWMMSFSAESQLALLRRMGLSIGARWRWLPVMLLPPAFIAAVVILGGWRRRRSARHRTDPALTTYARFLAKMNRAGLSKPDHLGPLDFACQVADTDPGLGAAVGEIVDTYIALRYGRDPSPMLAARFRRQVRQFTPRKHISVKR